MRPEPTEYGPAIAGGQGRTDEETLQAGAIFAWCWIGAGAAGIAAFLWGCL